MTRNQTEWCGFAFFTPERRIYCSGDGGYGAHFAEIGRRVGPFDFALLEDGQYNENWAKIHMFPEETAQAAVDVRAAHVIPAHGGKFALARHPWTEPYERLLTASVAQPYALLTPQMGACVPLDRPEGGTAWWRTIEKSPAGE